MINNDGLEDFGADRLIAIPWNAGEMARYIFTRRAETEWVCFQDDDWLIRDIRFLEDAINEHKSTGAVLLGVAGRHIQLSPPHYQPEAQLNSYTNFLKGHFQLFRKDALSGAHISWHPFRSDIQWGLDLSRGKNVHWVSANLKSRLIRMDTHGEGLEFRPEHWTEAEQVCADYITEYGFA